MAKDLAGGAVVRKKSLPIFVLIDVSGSMKGLKMDSVNKAMGEIVPEIKKVASENAMLDFNIRVMTYGNNQAEWKIGTKVKGVLVDELQWLPISNAEVDGGTPADKAMDLLASISNSREYLGGLIGTPMAILISDGESNGTVPFSEAVDKFRDTKYGNKFIQVAIGIGTENNPRATDELKYFGRDGFRHCTNNPEEIVKCLVLTTMTTLKDSTNASVKAGAKD